MHCILVTCLIYLFNRATIQYLDFERPMSCYFLCSVTQNEMCFVSYILLELFSFHNLILMSSWSFHHIPTVSEGRLIIMIQPFMSRCIDLYTLYQVLRRRHLLTCQHYLQTLKSDIMVLCHRRLLFINHQRNSSQDNDRKAFFIINIGQVIGCV